MTGEELLTLLHEAGITLRLDEQGRIAASPAERVGPKIRELIGQHRDELVAALEPPSFLNVKAAVGKLEKQAGLRAALPEPKWIVILHRDHTHSGAEVAEAQRRLWAAAVARYRTTLNEDDLGLGVLHVGHDACGVCHEPHTPPLPEPAVHQ